MQVVYRKQGARPTVSIEGPLGYENRTRQMKETRAEPWPIQTWVQIKRKIQKNKDTMKCEKNEKR